MSKNVENKALFIDNERRFQYDNNTDTDTYRLCIAHQAYLPKYPTATILEFDTRCYKSKTR